MGCRGCANADASNRPMGELFVSCLSSSLLVGYSNGVWGPAQHHMLYLALSNIPEFVSEVGVTPEEIAAVPYGENPRDTADLAMAFPVAFLPETHNFWSCIEIAKADAIQQAHDQTGAYWLMLSWAGRIVLDAESGPRAVSRRRAASGGKLAVGLATAGTIVFGCLVGGR